MTSPEESSAAGGQHTPADEPAISKTLYDATERIEEGAPELRAISDSIADVLAPLAELTDPAMLSQMLGPVRSVERTQMGPLGYSGATHERLDVALQRGDRVGGQFFVVQCLDHVLVAEQQPFIYLVHKNSLSAIANTVGGADPVALSPQTYWNIERISLLSEGAAK